MSVYPENITSGDGKKWEDILSGCIRNDRSAQETLYRYFFPIMEKMVIRHTRDEDVIISILNDGFLKVFMKLSTFEAKGSLEGWIRRIMYHTISDYFRRHKNDLKFLIFDGQEPAKKTSADHGLYYQDLISLVEKLPDMHMKVFHLYAIEGFNQKEISDNLNINHNTCRWYLSEARRLLREAYEKNYLKDLNEAG